MKVLHKITLLYIWRFFVSSNGKSSDLTAMVSHYFATLTTVTDAVSYRGLGF